MLLLQWFFSLADQLCLPACLPAWVGFLFHNSPLGSSSSLPCFALLCCCLMLTIRSTLTDSIIVNSPVNYPVVVNETLGLMMNATIEMNEKERTQNKTFSVTTREREREKERDKFIFPVAVLVMMLRFIVQRERSRRTRKRGSMTGHEVLKSYKPYPYLRLSSNVRGEFVVVITGTRYVVPVVPQCFTR